MERKFLITAEAILRSEKAMISPGAGHRKPDPALLQYPSKLDDSRHTGLEFPPSGPNWRGTFGFLIFGIGLMLAANLLAPWWGLPRFIRLYLFAGLMGTITVIVILVVVYFFIEGTERAFR